MMGAWPSIAWSRQRNTGAPGPVAARYPPMPILQRALSGGDPARPRGARPGQNERLGLQKKHGRKHWSPHQRTVCPEDWGDASVDLAPEPRGTGSAQPNHVEAECAPPATLPVGEGHNGGALTYAHC
ncbi:hypothetical protein NDU88_000481 [Pleurodeles waltl]|uniref:Uncharacterized protein n=1 Tax=Pleurodeles waltl TaxID=8319 RepID=A0AAV7KMW3_PLEWA|nr:hypothetical protein NDU88_000481 [Pleurodeles waltl]